MKKINIGPFLIMLAAGLWAADGLIRTRLSSGIPPASIVFFEHIVGFIILSPLLFHNWRFVQKLNKRDWLIGVLLACVSAVMGTLLFTEALSRSFESFDFTTPNLLQKLQPLFVIGLSVGFLREKITFRFIVLSVIALIGSYLISFGFNIVDLSLDGKIIVYLLSIGAAFSWGLGTILSKNLLGKLEFSEVTILRFGLAIPISFFVAMILGELYNPANLEVSDIVYFILIALFTGAASILIYYRGLKITEAKVSTIAELMFPVVSIIIAITSLNPYGEPQQLSIGNIVGILLLIGSILLISLNSRIDEKRHKNNR